MLKQLIQWLRPPLPEAEKLKRQYRMLCQRKLQLNRENKVYMELEIEINRLIRRMDQIKKQRNQENTEDAQLMDQALKEVDEEFPYTKQIILDKRLRESDEFYDYY